MDPSDRPHLALVGGVGRTKGNEFVDGDGVRLYINHQPHFIVQYWPQRHPEEVCYREWQEQVILYGHHLRDLYEALKAKAPEVLTVDTGPYDPDSPTPSIQRLVHLGPR